MSKDVDCPYCGKGQDIDHDDGYGYEENEVHNQECDSCEKTYTFSTSIMYYYEADKADCLNGSKCRWKVRIACPRESSKMACQDCDSTRQLTSKEKMINNIPKLLI